MRLLLAILFLTFSALRAFANDSEAEIALGGLQLKPSPDISLDREDLFISMEEVRVDYRFTNHGASDINTLVAFPLPDITFNEDSPRGFLDYARDVNFNTIADGKPVTYTWVEQAVLDDKDITDRVKSAGLPLNGDAPEFRTAASKVGQDQLDSLVADGILDKYGDANTTIYAAKWKLRTLVTRQQVFPAGRTIEVHHRYKPIAGGSVAGALEKASRTEDWGKEHAAAYCIENGWFKSFDALSKRRIGPDGFAPYSEVWLAYVLKSGANWQGPIREFRLVIDKGKPDNLVSFCESGVKKISPTQFEVRKTDFEPENDINILIVNWADP